MAEQSTHGALSKMVQFQATQNSDGSSPRNLKLSSLITSTSSVSNSTVDTELVSPVFSGEYRFASKSTQISSRPELLRDFSSSSDATNSDASSYAADTTLNKGSKRTASGVLKQSSPTRGLTSHIQESPRTGVQVNKLSADLQSRLQYAMYKVQNGWETQNIDEIEHLSKSHFPVPESPATEFSRRESISSDTYLLSPTVRTSPSHESSRVLQKQMQIPPWAIRAQQPHSPQYYHRSLAPALQILTPRRPRERSFGTKAPPALAKSSSDSYRNTVAASPQTPSSSIPSVFKASSMIQNQAEKDAIDTLLFMSSPNNSKNMKYGSQGSPPVKTKRVEFDPRVERR